MSEMAYVFLFVKQKLSLISNTEYDPNNEYSH